MIRALMIILCAFLFGPTPAKLPIKKVQKALNASVLLRMKTFKDTTGNREYSGCSGTYISPTRILTAAHCFVDHPVEYTWVKGPSDSVGYPAHLILLDGSHDLALLETPYRHPYVKLGNTPKQGEEVFNIGSPFNFEFVVSEGVVAALNWSIIYYKSPGYRSHYLVTTAMINPGSSGGGCFNAKGELIGVNTRLVGFLGWNGLSLAVSG